MHVKTFVALFVAGSAVTGCSYDSDPASGGFLAGVQGISSGGYQAQTDALEQDVAVATARNQELEAQKAALAAQIAQAQSDWSTAKGALASQRASTSNLDAATAARVDATLALTPSGSTDEELLASLQSAISNARSLSEELANLAT
ncbi:MAG: hypothetical protein AAF667_16405 [Pseudomonadota bacterium]